MPLSPPTPWRRQSFRNQLTLWFGSLCLLALLGGGAYVGRIATQEIASSGGEALYVSARSAADLLNTHLRERSQEIDLMRQSPMLMRGALDSADLRRVLDARKATHGEYAWIGVTDADGNVLQATGGLLVGEKVNKRPWFISARSGLFIGDVHEAVLLAKRLPNAQPDQPLRFIDFAAPILGDNGELRGVLGSHAHWAWVTETVESVVLNQAARLRTEVLIADQAGNVLYPFRHAGQLHLPKRQQPGAHYETLAWADGGNYLTSMVTVSLPNDAAPEWRIALRQPIDVAFAEVKALRQRLVVLGLLMAALCAFIAHRLASRVSRPVEQLALAAGQIERRDGTPVYPQSGHSAEIDQLNQSFQSMTHSLLERESELSRLNASLEAQVTERTEALHRANAELGRLVVRDALTGLYNRRRFDEKLREDFLLFQRGGRAFAVLMIDVDHFKRINDTYGHPAGDAVLQHLAGVIADSVRTTDFVARYGGEEFLVLLPEPQQGEEALVVAEKIRRAVAAEPFPMVGHLTVSLGLSRANLDDAAGAEVVQRADQGLYLAKQQGRNRTVSVPVDNGAPTTANT